jgi:hypothetical protein
VHRLAQADDGPRWPRPVSIGTSVKDQASNESCSGMVLATALSSPSRS